MKKIFILLALITLTSCTNSNMNALSDLELQACSLAEELLVELRGDQNVLDIYECVIENQLSNLDIGQVGLYLKPTDDTTEYQALATYKEEIENHGLSMTFSLAVISEKNLIFRGFDKTYYIKEDDLFIQYSLDEFQIEYPELIIEYTE